jgi:rubredoxin
MNMNTDSRCQNNSLREPIRGGASFDSRGHSQGYRTDWRCPNCGGSDLKKASLAYQEGVYRVDTKIRLRALLFGSGGPNVIVGKAVTRGVHQTQLSRRLRPPMKWSYLKLLGWTVVISFTVLIVYVHSVMGSSTKVSALPTELGMFGVATGFLLLLFLVWRHNHLAYPGRYAKWNDSWLCERCGGVSSQRPR